MQTRHPGPLGACGSERRGARASELLRLPARSQEKLAVGRDTGYVPWAPTLSAARGSRPRVGARRGPPWVRLWMACIPGASLW